MPIVAVMRRGVLSGLRNRQRLGAFQWHPERYPVVLLSLLIIIVCFVFSGNAHANAGIPGPLMWAATPHVGNPLIWLAASMFMCIGIEGAIYRYLDLFYRPLIASAYANVWSLFAGIPLIFVGSIDPTLVVSPTIVSILVEWFVLRRYRRFHPGPAKDPATPPRPIFWPVVLSNVLTNVIMFVYLFRATGLGF